MTATFKGTKTIAQSVPGYASALQEVGDALVALRNVCTAQSAALVGLQAVCSASGLPSIQVALDGIRAQLQANVNSGIALQGTISAVIDAAAYMAEIQAGIQAGLSALAAADPLDFLDNQQLSVDASVSSSVAAKVDFDTNISAALDASLGDGSICVAGILAVSQALSAAQLAVTDAISRYHSTVSLANAHGVNVVHFEGDAANFSTETGAALPVAGPVHTVTLAVSDADAAALGNFELFFGMDQ